MLDFGLPPSEAPAVALPTRIGFGSCSDPTAPLDLLEVATALEPELYLWLGDNVYADTVDEPVMREAYHALARAPEVERLLRQAHFLATWDDHDFGWNDAGRDYPMRETSREIFLEFWREPPASERWDRDGIYAAYRYEEDGHSLQVVLLDTRYNRDPLVPNDGTGKNDYIPDEAEGSTMLGEAQWAWLRERLLEPAELRIVATSIQLAHGYNGYESWTLFPRERERFVALVQETGAEGVLLLSGDLHAAEVSRLDVADGYPLYDVTSSGINQDWPFVEANENRVGAPVREHNVGLLLIDWAAASLTASIHDATGAARLTLSLTFDELSR